MKLQKQYRVFVLPGANKNNTYIDLFISSIQTAGADSVEVVKLERDNIYTIRKNLAEPAFFDSVNIIHIHWPTVLFGSRFAIKSLFLITRNILFLRYLKACHNFKIVWTVHNFFAHDYPHPWIDRLAEGLLRTVVDRIIVQQKITLTDFQNRFPQKREKISYIPHGNYIDVYGGLKSQHLPEVQNLRKQFGFVEKDIVFLSFGAIAPYKSNEKIIQAFQKIEPSATVQLLIVGKGREEYVHVLQKAASDPRIVIKNGFIPNDQISQYLGMADYSVFYYDASEMTSGGLILSLSYGVPVIIRNIPATEIVTPTEGFVFNNEKELEEIFVRIARESTSKKSISDENRHATINRIKNQSWSNSGQELIKIYGELS